MRLRHAAHGRAVIFSQRTRVNMLRKYRTYRFLTGCNPSQPCSSRLNGDVDGKKPRTVLRAIRVTRGTSIETPACRSASQAVKDSLQSKVSGMQGVNSGQNRRSTACECNTPSKQTAN